MIQSPMLCLVLLRVRVNVGVSVSVRVSRVKFGVRVRIRVGVGHEVAMQVCVHALVTHGCSVWFCWGLGLGLG